MSEQIHNFANSLARSATYADAPWWLEVYRQAFPSLEAAVSVRQDGWAQRGGIDRVLTLAGGKTVAIDEKVRDRDWDDVALEYWSDEGRKIRGWVAKDLACDFIAYAFAPSQRCLLLPFLTLRKAWRDHGQEWVRDFPAVRARNSTYVTLSVAVPIDTLLGALRDAMVVHWGRA